jgi:hypothetical protein
VSARNDFRLRVQLVGERFFFTLRHIRPMPRKHSVGHSSEQNRVDGVEERELVVAETPIAPRGSGNEINAVIWPSGLGR